MFKYIKERSMGMSKRLSFLQYLKIMFHHFSFEINIYGTKLDSQNIFSFFENTCGDCTFLHKVLYHRFYNEKILLDLYLPLLDKIMFLKTCCELMLMFCSIKHVFGKSAVLKSCYVLVEKWYDYYDLRYWGCYCTLSNENLSLLYQRYVLQTVASPHPALAFGYGITEEQELGVSSLLEYYYNLIEDEELSVKFKGVGSLDYYFRKAMKIGDLQDINQWANL